jgi:adenylate cyclase
MAAVLAADVAGYSRLMGADEDATIAALGRAREVFRAAVEGHDGRVVDTAGDSVLAIFESVVEAVRGALSVQEILAIHDADVAEDRRMRFRIGIHFGDIVEQDDGTIYGDGVNIAARLESLAEPGGLTISGTVHEHVDGKLGIDISDLGEQEVKNIAKPVRAWRVAVGGEPAPASQRRGKRLALIAVAVALVVIASGGAWQILEPGGGKLDAPAGPDLALTMPTGPKIAVIPFTNSSGDPNDKFFSDGLTEDIITRLTGFQDLFIFARNSTSKYAGQNGVAGTIGEELGADTSLKAAFADRRMICV